jgi:hypothetical protein
MRAERPNEAKVTLVAAVAVLAVAGCWTAPIASVQPKGQPHLIQGAIAVESVKRPATVVSVDAGTRTIVLFDPSDLARTTYKAGPRVSNFGQIKAGGKVQATVAEELAVYVLKNGQLPGAGGMAETIKADAKVLTVDPSYRLLTLQYPDGRAETFKVGLDVKLLQMEPGDDVVVRNIEATALKVRKP